MRKVGLLFGSFNPVHNGHVLFVESALAKTDCDEVWLVAQDNNPYKQQEGLASLTDRIKMCELAFGDNLNVKILGTHKAHMTSEILGLQWQYPNNQFVILLGQDVAASLPDWPDYEQIVADFTVYYHPRPGFRLPESEHLIPIDADELDFSSTDVRAKMGNQRSVYSLVPERVNKYIAEKKLYSTT